MSLCLARGESMAVDDLLPLPVWNDEDAATLQMEPDILPLSGLLWPDNFDPDKILPPDPHLASTPGEGEPSLSPPPRNSRGLGDNFLLFIPKPPAPVVQRALPPDKPLTEVTREFMEQSELLEPDAFLLDPHMLLPEIQSEDLRRLLTFHVSQSQTSAYFLMLDTHEKLSPKVDLSRLAGGRLTKEHACLAAFPLGQPWRARLFVTREIATGVEPGYLPGILEACVQDAMRASDPMDQLQRFATQLSIRLIWMERAYPKLFTVEEAAPAEVVKKVVPESPTAFVLADVSQPLVPEDDLWTKWTLLTREHGRVMLLSFSGFLLLVAGLIRLIHWHKRRRGSTVWMLPEVESAPRFGGAHCGGGGAWIKYGA
ncbi:hypothetical protein DES53_10727 [Roseimicrobium gellanilyticum]|uniref:Uncharacterized protein n=1 Tax=Roseimicrobium gellanilyticum TaxID=748857 RepID=A0A366HFB4_9BACT|nr:hypothetical protein [Roseimicrobium gellanilyticum]RBP41198.1 hypothetical protein DES53_10727 [Roseimicrobium gellanilyticum]